MRNFNKPCIDCGTLTRNTRCETCTSKLPPKPVDPEKAARKKALYGWQYQQARKQLIATATHCHICGKPFHPGDKIEADHLIPGHPQSPLAAAHRRCNQARGNKPLEQTFE